MLLLIIIWIMQLWPLASGEGINCCKQARFSICRKACLQTAKFGKLPQKITRIRRACPDQELRFWGCLNSTLSISKGRYPHSICCYSARASSCAVGCFVSRNTHLIGDFCSRKTEVELRSCLNKVEIRRNCCNLGKTNDCRSHCRKAIMTDVKPNSVKNFALDRFCKNSSAVRECLYGRQSGKRETKFLRCCMFGKSLGCRQECQRLFDQNIKERDLVTRLNKVCGPTDLQDDLYRCIFDVISNSESNSFQEQCCALARSDACKSWCNRGFSSKSYVSPDDPLYIQCMENPSEYELSTCIGDVFEPCKFGCREQLTFCSNFNNRPLELFRRCDARADKAARNLYNLWKRGEFAYLPPSVSVRSIVSCEPNLWKALACTLAIRPCSRKSSRNQICRKDCVGLLKQCTVKRGPKTDVENICMKLMPNPDQNDCVTPSKYASPGNATDEKFATFPCQNDPCKQDEVCSMNQECSFGRRSENCRPYKCMPGCSLSSAPNIKVRNLSLVKVHVSTKGKVCNRVCQCLAVRKMVIDDLSSCTDIGCHTMASCVVGNKMKGHKSSFNFRGNLCTCFDGELICLKNYDILQNGAIRGSSCDCNTEIYNPVCGINGMTYPSICHARCIGMRDDQLFPGACSLEKSCNPSPCPSKLVCMPRRRVCLLSMFICPQYDCVEPKETLKMVEPCLLDNDQTEDCAKEPVLHYCCKGSCHVKFNSAPVCGLDGVTYNSFCDAARHLVPVDYEGPCISQMAMHKNRCQHARCSLREGSSCNMHIPVGGCCPICEPLVRILYSQRETNIHIEKVSPKPIIVLDILEQLSNNLLVSECVVRGYLSVEGDITMMVRSNLKQKNSYQRQICEREAERLTVLINSRSPLITTNYYLSTAKAAFIQYPPEHKANCIELTTPYIHSLFLAIFLALCVANSLS